MIALVKNLPLLEKISIGSYFDENVGSRNLTSKCILELAKLPNLKSLGFGISFIKQLQFILLALRYSRH